MDSVFTKIINGEIPAHRLYDDDKCMVILDISPVQPGHCLVIPKKQVEFIWDIDDELYQYLWEVAKKMAKHMRETLNVNRVGVIVDGEAMPHVHIQLIPANGPHDMSARPQDGEPDHIALRAMADKLRITN